jgi:H+/Cl- antiporter ClcA
MEPTTVLMFIVVGASIGLFGMAISHMFKTFQEVKSETAQ